MAPATAADDQLLRRLRALFAEELQDGLHVLSTGLLEWEADAGAAAAAERVQDLFRAAHSLKGAAHAADFPEAAGVCDRLENAFAAVRDGDLSVDRALVTRLLGETDVLGALAAQLRESPAAASPDAHPVQAPSARRTAGSGLAPARTTAAGGAALRITADRVDALLQQTGEALAASAQVSVVAGQAAHAAERIEAARARLRSTDHTTGAYLEQLLDEAAEAAAVVVRSAELAERTSRRTSTAAALAAQRLRTQPFGDACTGLDRVVRDVAAAGGKHVQLHLSGGDVDVDRSVVAALRDPLLHLVRNAVDHGIESPEARVSAGKPTTGTVEVAATLDGSLLTVVVRDDGGGVDMQRLREVAESRGLRAPVEDDELPFLPGLSSRTDVTVVSGRGVGLDAVRARLEQLGGAVQMVAHPGGGTVATLTCPVTLALLRVLLVRAAGHVVAVPTSSVQRVEHVDPQALREVEGSVVLTVGGTSMRVVSLGSAMGLDGTARDGGEQLAAIVPRGGNAVLVAEAVLEEVELAVQPVPARLDGAVGVLGVASLATGLPALVVNPVALGRHHGPFRVDAVPAAQAVPARILLAEDTVTTRALERSILEAAGYSVAVAVDGADAWEQLQADGADLLVSDVDMPRMTGIDLCRRIRSSTRFRDLPVVLVTSLGGEADKQGGLAAGADAYVVKAEFTQGSLLDTIARLL